MYLLLKQQKLLLENFLIRNTPFLFLLWSIKTFCVGSFNRWMISHIFSVVSIWYLLTLDPLYCLPCQLYKVLFIFYVNGFQINRKTFYHFMRYSKIFLWQCFKKDRKTKLHFIQFLEKLGFHTHTFYFDISCDKMITWKIFGYEVPFYEYWGWIIKKFLYQ